MYHLNSDAFDALVYHCIAIAALLVISGVALASRRLFNLTKSGFWIWFAQFLFFFLNPVATLCFSDRMIYVGRLAVTDGASRIYVVLLAICLGNVAFFVAYVGTRPTRKLGRCSLPLNRTTICALTISFVIALYCLLMYRSTVSEGVEWGQVNGQFVGDVGGWQVAMHRFALFPILFFCAVRKLRLLGCVALGIVTLVRLFDPEDRFTVIAPILAVVLLLLVERRLTAPPVWGYAVLLIPLAFLIGRGHISVAEVHQMSFRDFAEPIVELFSGPNTDMLPQMYVVTSVYDENGYTFGVPLVESALFGYLPRSYFPWKDKLFDTFIYKPSDRATIQLLYGPKASIIGSFYSYGSHIAVMIGMIGVGYFCRKLDGMLNMEQPVSVRAIGALWMSFVWMFYASDPSWTLQYLVLTAIPLGAALAANRLVVGGMTSYRRSTVG